MSSGHYDHRQSTVIFMAAIIVVFVAAGWRATTGSPVAATVLAVLAVLVIGTIVGVSALHTSVTDRELTVAFRFGWPIRRIDISSISSHRPVRNSWWWGFGVRLVPTGGWMYNVWGLDAVEVHYTDHHGAEQIFRIGTDDPEGLNAALAAATSSPR
ncbi:MAG: hypothetical protein AAF467_14955 [Actinomycetota bacterium]